jgi:TonB family protein
MLMKSKDKTTTVAAATPTETKPAGDTGSAAPDKAAAPATDTVAKPADTGSAAGSATEVATAEPPKAETKTEAKTETKTPSHTAVASHTATPSHTAAPSHTVAHTETAAKTETKAPSGDSGGCDEVSCVLNNYDGACCAKFRKKGAGGGGAAPSGGAAHSDLPDALDRSMISAGIANVKARVSACGDKSSAKGKVKVHVKVGGDGRVSSVNVETSPDAALGACVQAAVQRASFSKTQSGGSFSYPFVF